MSLRFDDLFIGGYGIWQNTDQFRYSADAVLLYDAVADCHKNIVDLCSGNGIVALLLLAGEKVPRVTTVELRSDAVASARKSAADNGCAGQMDIMEGDLRSIETLLPAGDFDAVCVNPPYFTKGSGILPKDPSVAVSRYELECTLKDVLHAAEYLLCPNGTFYMIHRTERQTEIENLLPLYGFSLCELRQVYIKPGQPSSLFLLTARKGKPPKEINYTEITIYDRDGHFSRQYRQIYEKESL